MLHLQTTAGAAFGLVVAALLWYAGRQRWPRTTMWFTLGGAAGIQGTLIGIYIHQGWSWVFAALGPYAGKLLGATAGAVAFVAGLVIAGVVASHHHHRSISERTLLLTASVPFVAPFVPGPFGTALMDISSFAAHVVGSIFFFLFSGHL